MSGSVLPSKQIFNDPLTLTMAQSMPQCTPEKEFEGMSPKDVISKMRTEDYTLEICDWGMRAFVSITGTAMLNNSSEAMAGKTPKVLVVVLIVVEIFIL